MAASLEESQSTGHGEVGQQKRRKHAQRLSRQEQERSEGINGQSRHHTRLEAVFHNQPGRWKGHDQIAQVVGNDGHTAFAHADSEYL